MSDVVLTVEVREKTGTGGARDSRRRGRVPGVLYGNGKGPVAIELELNELRRSLNRGGFLSQLVSITHKGEAQPVLVREVQFHPVTSEPLHIDLYRVDEAQEINIEVAVTFTNEETSPGLKRGGALNVVRHQVELLCRADSIPDELVVDLSEADIGDSLHISSVKLPKGVRPAIDDRDFTIATIVGRMAKEEEPSAVEEAPETEVINQKDDAVEADAEE
jgi:large subunit ribosomal protein L25